MKAFLDTSVLVAAFYTHHLHHEPSAALLGRYGKHDIGCGAHTLAELYSTLTGIPGKDRVSGDEAMLFLGNIRERFTLIALDEKEYCSAIGQSCEEGITGAAIYDALIAHCALKANAKVIYTWNVRDFTRLGPDIASRVRTP